MIESQHNCTCICVYRRAKGDNDIIKKANGWIINYENNEREDVLRVKESAKEARNTNRMYKR